MLDKEALVYKYTASICSQKMSNDVAIKIPYNYVISHKKFLVDFRAAKSANFVSQINKIIFISKFLCHNIYIFKVANYKCSIPLKFTILTPPDSY